MPCEAVWNITDDSMSQVYDPNGWNPYPEVIPPNKDFKLHHISH